VGDPKVLDDFVHKVHVYADRERLTTIEDRIRLVISPAPRFIPEWLWYRIAVKFVVMQNMPKESR